MLGDRLPVNLVSDISSILIAQGNQEDLDDEEIKRP